MKEGNENTGTTNVEDLKFVLGCENRTNGLLPLWDDPWRPAHGRSDITALQSLGKRRSVTEVSLPSD